MSQVHVLVATTSGDLAAEVISVAVARSTDMVLIGERAVPVAEAEKLLAEFSPAADCVLVLVGPAAGTGTIAARWLRRRQHLVVVRVNVVQDIVQIATRNVGLESLLSAMRDLAHRAMSVRSVRCAFAPLASGTRH